MKIKAASLLGWYGVFAILGAYGLVNFNMVDVDSYVYQLLNLTGALGIVTVAAVKKDVQPMVLNTIWALIALVAVIKLG